MSAPLSSAPVVACVKPVPLGEPGVSRGQLVVEGLAWGLPASERRTLAAARAAALALGTEVVALALGPEDARPGLREALALGARRAVLVVSDGQRLDAILTARALAAAIRGLGEPQAVVAGGESADAQQGLLGAMLAEMLALDLVSGVDSLQGGAGGTLALRRAAGAGEERVQAKPPVVLTVSPAFHPAPHPTSWGLGEAYELPLDTMRLAEVARREDLEPGSDLASLTRAETSRTEAQRYDGDPEEAATQLVRRLRAGGWVR